MQLANLSDDGSWRRLHSDLVNTTPTADTPWAARAALDLSPVPKKYNAGKRNYNPESLLLAYKAVKEKGMKIKTAARNFGVPTQTLRDRVKGLVNAENPNERWRAMTQEEEETLIERITTLSQLGYGITNTKLKQLAGELLHELGRKPDNKPMSNTWLYGFRKRWDQRIVSLKPRALDTNRVKSTTPEALEQYFKNLEISLQKRNLLDKPHLIYNIDETGIQPKHRPPNVIAPVGSKPQAITSPRSTTTTVIACANASGNSLPLYFVFKGKRYNPELMKGTSPGARGVMSDSGWSHGDVFLEYLKTHFLEHVPALGPQQSVLVIYDGHASHVNQELIDWASKNRVVLFVLPPHTSHVLQPLDVGIFGPFKSYYYSECASFMNAHMGQKITRFDMAKLACKAYLKAMTPLNIQSAFRKTGIHPLSSNAISTIYTIAHSIQCNV
ncbi:uncharacterized protein LOC127842149 [Dreissena polymorpha]|uniref:uncharacterized protein LOC127842149 n=1 Tax=Dreissena polymorpha TaxID=45954 RepID=UPI0022645F69|nr:uncharacterized protein LOC127842149 [Dreissena polymorpha]